MLEAIEIQFMAITRISEKLVIMAGSNGQVYLVDEEHAQIISVLLSDTVGPHITIQIPEDEFSLEPSGAMCTVIAYRYIAENKIVYLGYDAHRKIWWIHKNERWAVNGENP